MTRGNTSVLSMIAGMQNNPSQLDLDELKHFAAHLYTSKHIGITYYEGPTDRDIRKPMPFHAYCDSAESKHVDGQAHWAWAIKAGLRGHPGEATCWKSVKGSMTVNETMALLQLCKMIVTLRPAEEIAGLDPHGDVVDDIIPGSDGPTPTFESKQLLETISHDEPGILGHKAAEMASIILTHPPTWIGEDNQGTDTVVNHVSFQSNQSHISRH